ncbi:DedA family protein [Palleronia sp. KMU-117]|uniref:DedA family protein n=1 Tax=Palleronia sp. KMU-117 TaxID=3434108 RepID=UPI003D7491FD
MTELFFSLVSTYGALVIGVTTFLSCLALPIPSSFVMLAGGAFVASGDLTLLAVVGAAYAGAVIGDQAGYRAGRYGGQRLETRIAQVPARAALVARARAFVARWGAAGVFFSTWLVAPLGPWVNVAAGATGMGAVRFTFWDALGEAIWVAIYVGLGYAFAANIDALAGLLGNAVAAITAAAVAAGLGLLLLRAARTRP